MRLSTKVLAYAVLIGMCVSHGGSADTVVWVRASDNSLWKGSIPGPPAPTLLYGHGVNDLHLVPSPDGRSVAVGVSTSLASSVYENVYIFDSQHSGRRKTIKLREQEWFVGEWARDGSGILASEYTTPPVAAYLGTNRITMDGRRTLIVAAPAKGLEDAGDAAYSPSGSALAISASNWLQVVRLLPTTKTLLFARIDVGSGVPMIWLDDNRLAAFGVFEMRVIDITDKKKKWLFKYESIDSAVFNKSRGKLYASMKPSPTTEQGIYAIDLATGKAELLSFQGLEDIFGIDGITADGKTAIVGALDPEDPSPNWESGRSLWAVDLDTGKHTLITHDALLAAILPSPGFVVPERAK